MSFGGPARRVSGGADRRIERGGSCGEVDGLPLGVVEVRVGPAGVIPNVEFPRTAEGDDGPAQRNVVLSERLRMHAQAGNEQKYDP